MPAVDGQPVPQVRTTWRDQDYHWASRLTPVLGLLVLAGVLASFAGAAAGQLDPTFGTGGKVITDFGRNERANVVLLTRDGKSVVVGTADDGVGNEERLVLARYDRAGRLDPSFGVAGKAVVDLGTPQQSAQDAAILPDGKILVAGDTSNPGASADFLLARLNVKGTLDPSFGQGGIATADFGSTGDYAYAMVLQRDGKAVLVGVRWQPGPPARQSFALARFDPDGRIDTTFGSGGRVVTDFGATLEEAHGVAVQSDGRIVVVGSRFSSSDSIRAVVARYTARGVLDPTFDDHGWAGIADGGAADVAVLRNGAILVAGNKGRKPAVYRYTARGRLDSRFGAAGIASVALAPDDVTGTALAVQPDGEIVVAGAAGWDSLRFDPTAADLFVFRLNADGRPDELFGRMGIARADLGSHSVDVGNDVVVQENGKILVAGLTSPVFQYPYAFDVALARYDGAVCLVPRLKGETLRVARQRLARAHCKLGKTRTARSKVVRKGRIISQRPAPDARRAKGTRVSVVVSRGR